MNPTADPLIETVARLANAGDRAACRAIVATLAARAAEAESACDDLHCVLYEVTARLSAAKVVAANARRLATIAADVAG